MSKANDIDSASVSHFYYKLYPFFSGESYSTGAQSASALQPTTTVGTGAAAKAKQGTCIYDQYDQCNY